MVRDGDEQMSDQEKLRIVSNFILHTPPGEFNEVFNDVRVLLKNDVLLKEGTSQAFSQYNKDQLTPIKLENSNYPVLITEYNDLGGNRFFDPRSKQSFKYDHLKREATDYDRWEAEPGTEPWRLPLEKVLDIYTLNHYKNGAASVFAHKQGSDVILKACIEDHNFQPTNFWNGRWRSQWSVTLSNSVAEVKGILKVQVHYFEDGNVQLVSCKEIKETIPTTDEEQTANDIIHLIEEAESSYQKALTDNYHTMSDTTFKALRRQLPVTRTKVDWDKIISYSIGKELKSQ